jgi:diaminopimelate decarboxylase
LTPILPHFLYADNGRLFCEGVDVHDLAAAHGTPLYVSSQAAIQAAYERVKHAFSPIGAHLHYALKASSNIRIVRLLGQLGAGADVVSGGELERAWLAGIPMEHITFAGVGKTAPEIAAALDGAHSPLASCDDLPGGLRPHARGRVGLFNIESAGELERITSIAADLGITFQATIRVNPDVDAQTHAYTTTGKRENKFGVPLAHAQSLARDNPATVRGFHIHLGSPISKPQPFEDAIDKLLPALDQLRSEGPAILNIGGGFGVDYGGDAPPPASIEHFGERICAKLLPQTARGTLRIIIEPGRCIVAQAGVLLTRVQYVKDAGTKRFVVCDAGMHTLLRPALYSAYHFAWPAACCPRTIPTSLRPQIDPALLVTTDLVGPVCESSDFLAAGRPFPPVSPGDLLAIFCAGAYGQSMASTYNDHPKPAEVLVTGDQSKLIRRRDTTRALIAPEFGL